MMKATPKQVNELLSLSLRLQLSTRDVLTEAKAQNLVSPAPRRFKELSSSQADDVLSWLRQLLAEDPDKQEVRHVPE